MKNITAQALKKLIDSNKKLHLIDVRESWEHTKIDSNTKNIPLILLLKNVDTLLPLRKKEIIIYCQSGKRSDLAKKILEKNGFSKVKSLINGIDDYLKLV